MRKRRFSPPFVALLVAVLASVVSSQSAFAARLVRFQISIDGKGVLETGSGDTGTASADVAWRYLKGLKLGPARRNKDYKVVPDPDDPLRATLKGDVVIDCVYAGRAEVSELKLVRAKEDAPWQIAPEEVERTFKSRHKPFIFSISTMGKPTLWTVQRCRAGKAEDDRDNVWRELKGLIIYGRKIQPDGDDPLHATLNGTVVIELSYAGENWGRAEVSDVKLVRRDVRSQWKIEPTEVERARKNRKKEE